MNRRDFLKSIAAAGAGVVGSGETFAKAVPAKTPPEGMQGEHLVYTWKGTPFEIGFQHGQTLRDPIMKEAGPALAAAAKARGSEANALDFVLATYEPFFRDHAPMALEEVQGIARGSGLSYPYAFFAATRDGIRVPAVEAANCTALGCGKAATTGGKVLMGQNKDTTSTLDRYRIMRLGYHSGRRMILLNYPGWIANIGLTSDGVAFTGNSLYGQTYVGDVMPFCLVKRLILEKSSVAEVLAAIPKYPFDNGCLTIGDATGHLVCMEVVNGQVNVRDISDEAFGHANTMLVEGFKPMDTSAQVCPSSPVRQRNAQKDLDAHRGQLTVAKMQQLLGNHAEYPLSICRHREQAGQESTTASFVADLTDREMHIAIGNPCVAPYRRYTFDF